MARSGAESSPSRGALGRSGSRSHRSGSQLTAKGRRSDGPISHRKGGRGIGVSIAAELVDFLTVRRIQSWTAMAAGRWREWIDPVVVAAATHLAQVSTAAEVLWQPFPSVW